MGSEFFFECMPALRDKAHDGFCIHSILEHQQQPLDLPEARSWAVTVQAIYTVRQGMREGGMDRPSQHKSHPVGSLSYSQTGGPPCWVISIAFGVNGRDNVWLCWIPLNSWHTVCTCIHRLTVTPPNTLLRSRIGLYLPLWNYHSKASKLQTSTIHIFNTPKLHCSNDKIIMLHSPETLFNVSNLQISSDSKTPWLYSTKVHIYLEYHRVCPLVGLRLPTPSPANECVPPPTPLNQRGGHTRLPVRGWGSPNSDYLRKGLALCLLCVLQSTASMGPQSQCEQFKPLGMFLHFFYVLHKFHHLKGVVSRGGFCRWWHAWSVQGLNRGYGKFLNFLGAPMILY
jgi:hypothetical protein